MIAGVSLFTENGTLLFTDYKKSLELSIGKKLQMIGKKKHDSQRFVVKHISWSH